MNVHATTDKSNSMLAYCRLVPLVVATVDGTKGSRAKDLRTSAGGVREQRPLSRCMR